MPEIVGAQGMIKKRKNNYFSKISGSFITYE